MILAKDEFCGHFVQNPIKRARACVLGNKELTKSESDFCPTTVWCAYLCLWWFRDPNVASRRYVATTWLSPCPRFIAWPIAFLGCCSYEMIPTDRKRGIDIWHGIDKSYYYGVSGSNNWRWKGPFQTGIFLWWGYVWSVEIIERRSRWWRSEK